jgi:hypothetical protein
VPSDDPIGDVVVRVGVNGRSITVGAASSRTLYACDGGAEREVREEPWCGGAFARLERGRLLDPRLDLTGCTSPSGRPLAFVWLEPGQDVRYVAVRQPGYLEVYAMKGRLPMRIATTTGIDIEGSRASFELSEHDAEGRLLRAYDLDVRVAG